jgi:hypothetical protein
VKKIALVSLALVLALGGLGVGYAMWADTLYIKGNVSTGYADVDFGSQYDNDATNQVDPSEAGEWIFVDDETGEPLDDPIWEGTRYDKDVATTTSTFTGHTGDGSPTLIAAEVDTATINIVDGYPSYWGAVLWDIENNGTVPMKLNAVRLIRISVADSSVYEVPFADGEELTIGTLYFVDADNVDELGEPAPILDTELNPGDDFSFILSEHNLAQIDPITWTNPEAVLKGYIDIAVHVEQDAAQKALYDFSIAFQFCNWNEPEPEV